MKSIFVLLTCLFSINSLAQELVGPVKQETSAKVEAISASTKIDAAKSDEAKNGAESDESECKMEQQFSEVTYLDLKNKLAKTLDEKNESLIFLDYKTLLAQVDVLASHLLMTNVSEKEKAISLLKKSSDYLEQLESLLAKTKKAAKRIKEDHVIPLATLTSLKSDYDLCEGKESGYKEIFKSLSQLNVNLTEVMMVSTLKIKSRKKDIQKLISLLDDNSDTAEAKFSQVSSHLNFIQKQVNEVTSTFQFDTKNLNVASY